MRSSEFPTEQDPSGFDPGESSVPRNAQQAGRTEAPILANPYDDTTFAPDTSPAPAAGSAWTPAQSADVQAPQEPGTMTTSAPEVTSADAALAGSLGPAETAGPRPEEPLPSPWAGHEADADQVTADSPRGTSAPDATAVALMPLTGARNTGSTTPSAAASPRRRRHWPLWVAAAAFLICGAGVGGYAYANHYEERVVPGTTVAGIDVSGMTRQEVVTAIDSAAGQATVNVSGDVSDTATLADLGTTVDAEATADAVMNRGERIVDRFEALVSDESIPVVTDTDSQTVQDYAVGLIPDDRPKAVNAAVVLNQEGTGFEITPSADGTSVDANALEDAATQAAASLTATDVSVSFVTAPPAVSDSEAQTIADEANRWVALEVTIASADGDSSYTADATDKASWVTVETSTDAPPTLSLDAARVAAWVDEQAEEVTVEPVTGQRNVNASGTVLATSVEAVAGESVTNSEALVEAIITTVTGDQPYTGSFEMKTAEEEWEEKLIADGAENLAYPAAPSEKWVDINLSNKTVTAYEGATVVHGPVSMVDGAAATPTVTGTFKVYLKYESQTMRGENADGSNYVTEDVPWVSYFHQGYALHGAPWRSSFGYSGSHGCINMPVGEANWFYTWATIGTTVASHY